MKKFMMLALSLSCVTSSFISIQSANAEGYANSNGGYRTRQDALPDGSQFYHANRKAQILDERMEVSDHRRAPGAVHTILLNAPPPSGGPSTVTQIGAAPGGGENPYFTTPNAAYSSLPQSGFGSAPNANVSHANVGPLPNGTSVGSHAPVTAQQVSGRISPRDRLANMQKNGTGATAQSIATYNPYKTAGSNANSAMTIQTQAIGKLLGRLPKKQ
jgi:hypothetical protein